MAEDSDQEKTEEPTGKRLEDAQKKGQIARSKELNTYAMLLTSASLFMMLGDGIGNSLIVMMKKQFHISREAIFDPTHLTIQFKQSMIDGLLLITPILATLVVIAIIAPLALGGWIMSWDAISPKFEKMNPIAGLARMFAVHGLIEMCKALFKVILIGIVSYSLYQRFILPLITLGAEPLEQSIHHGLDIISQCILILSASLIAIVLFDVPMQLMEHNKKLKMTLQEIKDEMKESEGSPEVKGRQRRMQMDMAQNRMMAEVPNADVIITNPSHYAVALKYDPEKNAAPRLVAKGVDLMAAQIRNVAIASNIPLLAAPPLARALYYSTELEREIPQGLYLAVAQVLAYIFQLKTAREQRQSEPIPPRDLPVPKEFKQS
jgi:flagellar biosynthetic protein FlhB